MPESEDDMSARSSRKNSAIRRCGGFERHQSGVGTDQVTPGHLTHSERLQVITSLESAGIFLLKGAIKSAAAALGCSTASIYRYLPRSTL